MEQQTETFKKLILSLIKKSKAHFEQALKKANITITPLQYGILVHLDLNKEGITLNELSQYLANKPPTLIPAIDHLEDIKYITRDQDTNDRRKVKIIITSKGKEILKKLPPGSSSNLVRSGFTKLGKDKTHTLISLLKELTDNIDTYHE